MRQMFEEYGGTIISAIVVVALIAIVGVFLVQGGPVYDAFNDTVNGLFGQTGLPTP